MKKKILLLMFFISCNPFINDWDMRPSNAVDEVLKKHEKNYVNNLTINAQVFKTGGGGCFGISKISIGICTEKILTIESARKILLEGLLNLESEINSSLKLKEFLAIYPFPIENINYSVDRKVNGCWYKYPEGFKKNEITFAKYFNNKIHYAIDMFDDKLPMDVYEETLEEAMEKLGYTETHLLKN